MYLKKMKTTQQLPPVPRGDCVRYLLSIGSGGYKTCRNRRSAPESFLSDRSEDLWGQMRSRRCCIEPGGVPALTVYRVDTSRTSARPGSAPRPRWDENENGRARPMQTAGRRRSQRFARASENRGGVGELCACVLPALRARARV